MCYVIKKVPHFFFPFPLRFGNNSAGPDCFSSELCLNLDEEVLFVYGCLCLQIVVSEVLLKQGFTLILSPQDGRLSFFLRKELYLNMCTTPAKKRQT